MTDSTHSVSLSSSDTLDFAAITSSSTTYSNSFYCISARFDASSGSAQMLATVGPNSILPSTTPQYIHFLGILVPGTTTESWRQFYCLAAGTWQNMACHLHDNTFSTVTVITNRKNGSNGSMAISIPASTSGSFEDITHSTSVTVGDLLDYRIVALLPGGSGAISVDWIGAHFVATDAANCMIGGTPDPFLTDEIGPPTPVYSSMFGGGNFGDDKPRATGLFPYALSASRFTNHLIAADPLNAATFTVLKNGAATDLAVSSGNGQTGYFMISDIDHVDFAQNETCANQIVGTGQTGGTVKWAGSALLLTAST